MPTLLLSQRHGPDSVTMWRAALYTGRDVDRIRGYAIDPALAAREPVLYGETLLADALAEPLGLSFLEPTAVPAWASGPCDSDPLAVLGVLRMATVARADLVNEDRRWIRGAPGRGDAG